MNAKGTRFLGFDTLSQSRHWDAATAGVVLARTGMPASLRFFTPGEQAIATHLFDRLLDQDPVDRLPIVAQVDARLAEDQTDGWRYQDMPGDGQAWRDSLTGLDADSTDEYGCGFAACTPDQQNGVIQAVQDLGVSRWHEMVAERVWSLWIRYACTAFYAHPTAWNEIGFPGPAYPRGYKNTGVGVREPFEVQDARPDDDPLRAET